MQFTEEAVGGHGHAIGAKPIAQQFTTISQRVGVDIAPLAACSGMRVEPAVGDLARAGTDSSPMLLVALALGASGAVVVVASRCQSTSR